MSAPRSPRHWPLLTCAGGARPAIIYAQREGWWIAQHAQQNVAAIFAPTEFGRLAVTALFREPFSRNADGRIPTQRPGHVVHYYC